MIDAVERIGASLGITGDELAGRAVDHLRIARDNDSADLVLDLGFSRVDRERANVAPIEAERALPGDEELARVADIEVDLVRRSVFRRLQIDFESLAEPIVVGQR